MMSMKLRTYETLCDQCKCSVRHYSKKGLLMLGCTAHQSMSKAIRTNDCEGLAPMIAWVI